MQNKISSYPVDGKYGKYGGRFVPEVLMEGNQGTGSSLHKSKERPRLPKRTRLLPCRFRGQTDPAVFTLRI